jgi:hypothetical protein
MKLGGTKMKTINMMKIVPMVLLGFALSVQAQGDFKVTRVSQGNHQPAMVNWDYPVIKAGAPLIIKVDSFFQAEQVIDLQDWMFQSDYLQNDNVNLVEPWMTDETYLSEESPVCLENWMKDEDYLNSENRIPVESWMLSESYLNNR